MKTMNVINHKLRMGRGSSGPEEIGMCFDTYDVTLQAPDDVHDWRVVSVPADQINSWPLGGPVEVDF